jgi:hypothetical protein
LQNKGPVPGPSKVAPGGPAPASLRFATPAWVALSSLAFPAERDFDFWRQTTTPAPWPAYPASAPRDALQRELSRTHPAAAVPHEEGAEAAEEALAGAVEGAAGQGHGGLSGVGGRDGLSLLVALYHEFNVIFSSNARFPFKSMRRGVVLFL